ncbi:MAG: hypothetical protein AD073_000005 [Mycoplasmataceae bacterium]|nr:MAG: hypothetical protein AD073_000005 [Mycoplasmataceae bacterium]
MNLKSNLESEKMDLLDYLEKEIKINKKSYINDILNEESDWISLENIKDN